MTENKNLIPGSTEVIVTIVEAAKAYKARYDRLTLMEAFEQTLNGCYKYSAGWYKDSFNE